MRRILKLLLLWLVLLALPLQGYAAATMTCCGSARSAGLASAGLNVEPADSDRDVAVHHHGHGDLVATESSVEKTHLPHQRHDGSKGASPDCGSCAAACAGVALSRASESCFVTQQSGSTPIAFHPAYFYGFVPEGLERPPYRLTA